MRIFIALFFSAVFPLAAQTPQVPSKMEFAGITLTIRDDAQREIQKDVDALTMSQKHYNIKAERAKSYFPIIQKIFAEEQLPDDFKYLALQESALIADAVSVSNAVGFWQFKDFTAMEMGLRVDKNIDERKNIASSTRAAAKYLKKNNGFFNNWIYALQSYQMGAGGVLKSVKEPQNGATKMEITSQTYWYVKKFLAHKIAYEPAVSGRGMIELVEYPNSNGKSLSQLAKEVGVDEADLREYNKWVVREEIPTDRTYVVAIPVKGAQSVSLPAVANTERVVVNPVVPSAKIQSVKKRINGVLAIQALAGETPDMIASRAEVTVSKFLKWNDMNPGQKLIAGNFYYLNKKRGRASENFHKVVSGDDLWSISQHYGVQLKKLKKFNRLNNVAGLAAGSTIYLASTRPASDAAVDVKDPVGVDRDETFNWSASPDAENAPAKDSVNLPAIQLTQSSEAAQAETAPVVSEPTPSEAKPIEVAAENPTPVEIIESKPDTVLASQKTEHIVQAKETLYSIAKIYNVGVMDLVRWNDLDLQQGIKIGQVLKLTDNQPVINQPVAVVASKEVVHEVKSSDTLYSVARQYGVTIKDIMDWNEKKDFSLSVGEKLKILQRP